MLNSLNSSSSNNGPDFDDQSFGDMVKEWFAEGNVNRTRNIIFAILAGILLIMVACGVGAFILDVRNANLAASETPVIPVIEPTEAPVATEPPVAEVEEVINAVGSVSIASVLPEKVEAGSEIKVVFAFTPADNTSVQDYTFQMLGPDKKTLLKDNITPLTEFTVKTPDVAGDNTEVGYVVAVHKTDAAKSSELKLVREDTTAPVVVADPIVEAEPELAADPNGCPARVTIEPPANAFVNAEDGKVYSFSYKLEEDRPYVVTVPCGSVSTMAFGNATINGQKFTASEIEGNVVYTTCDQPLGCDYKVEDFTAGHFIVTIVYPGMEEPLQSVFNAVSNMFDPSNCGGSGCPIAYLTDADHLDKTVKFDKKPAIGEISINDFTVKPTVGSVIGEPTTKTIKVNGVEVGQVYSLESKELQYIGVPEQHDGLITGLYIECPNGCVVYGTTLKSGESAEVYGNSGDSGSPNDLNWTVGVQSDSPETVKVFFIYADNVDDYAGKPTYKFNSNGLMK